MELKNIKLSKIIQMKKIKQHLFLFSVESKTTELKGTNHRNMSLKGELERIEEY